METMHRFTPSPSDSSIQAQPIIPSPQYFSPIYEKDVITIIPSSFCNSSVERRSCTMTDESRNSRQMNKANVNSQSNRNATDDGTYGHQNGRPMFELPPYSHQAHTSLSSSPHQRHTTMGPPPHHITHHQGDTHHRGTWPYELTPVKYSQGPGPPSQQWTYSANNHHRHHGHHQYEPQNYYNSNHHHYHQMYHHQQPFGVTGELYMKNGPYHHSESISERDGILPPPPPPPPPASSLSYSHGQMMDYSLPAVTPVRAPPPPDATPPLHPIDSDWRSQRSILHNSNSFNNNKITNSSSSSEATNPIVICSKEHSHIGGKTKKSEPPSTKLSSRAKESFATSPSLSSTISRGSSKPLTTYSFSSRNNVNMKTHNNKRLIWALHEYDIVCGRGAPSNVMPGNAMFKELVNEYQMEYLCSRRCDKPRIAWKIYDTIQSRGGRFVRRNKLFKAATAMTAAATTTKATTSVTPAKGSRDRDSSSHVATPTTTTDDSSQSKSFNEDDTKAVSSSNVMSYDNNTVEGGDPTALSQFSLAGSSSSILSSSPSSFAWEELSDRQSFEKICQSLREGAPEMRRRMIQLSERE